MLSGLLCKEKTQLEWNMQRTIKKALMSVERADNRNQKLLFQSAEPNYGLLETKNFWVIDMMGMEHDDTKKKKDYL